MNKYSQKFIRSKVLQNIKQNHLIESGDEVIVAVSGGPDSVCLLHILNSLKQELKFELLACHYNHRLRGEDSYNDEEFVKNICREWGIECIFGQAENENIYKNEESARNARYGFFEKILGERRGAKIAIAHNSNDAAETFILRLFRGTGIFGLLSIPSAREKFIRPLLNISRVEIEDYLKDNDINYRLDKTNSDLRFARNFVRLKLLPEIAKNLNPNIVETLSNSAKVFEDDYSLLQELTLNEYKNMARKTNDSVVLDRKKWLDLHPALRRSTIRMAIANASELTNITNKQISEVCELVQKGIGRKHKVLPHSLQIELASGKIVVSKIR